jgi:hypothetical protein
MPNFLVRDNNSKLRPPPGPVRRTLMHTHGTAHYKITL